jgi:hypothetical protein
MWLAVKQFSYFTVFYWNYETEARVLKSHFEQYMKCIAMVSDIVLQ